MTPILDFVQNYLASSPLRLHMPGHKGVGPLGCEALDITEIDGAGSLYAAAEGPIAESEAIASRLLGMPTWYSAEGSSLALRAMLRLALSRDPAPRPVVLAGRNAHAAFMSAAALLDFDVEWLLPASGATCHSCPIGPEDVDAALDRLGGRCRTVFVTSPDYLGHTLDLAALADACHRRGALLLVDNAHGTYLKFLTPSRHPVDLGADLCCDSAHKTLPVLTGGAYLHASPALGLDAGEVKRALMLFGSTSPSWLILQSLDACNPYLETLPERLLEFLPKLDALRSTLVNHGYTLAGDEPMKLTIDARPLGTTGDALAEYLATKHIACELHDPDFLVLMPTPQNTDADLAALRDALLAFAPSELSEETTTSDPSVQLSSLNEETTSSAPSGHLPLKGKAFGVGAPFDSEPSPLGEGGFDEKRKRFSSKTDEVVSLAFPSGEGGAAQSAVTDEVVSLSPSAPYEVVLPPRAMTIRQALLAPRETLPADQCVGRVLAAPALSCPPCVPLAACGERLTPAVIQALRHYGIETCEVVMENEK